MTSPLNGSHSHSNFRNSSSGAPLINNARNKRRLSDELPSFLGSYIPTLSDNDRRRAVTNTGTDSDYHYSQALAYIHALQMRLQDLQRPRINDFLDVRILLVLFWAFVLWWGETAVFDRQVSKCAWNNWEEWPQGADPYHVLLVADPQLVDPHTYPGRPWPLSSLTVAYTDSYMRKNFQHLTGTLAPDSLMFLGDLFDGGREWSPPNYENDQEVDRRWWGYGQEQWLKEYKRFGRIFFNTWLRRAQDGGSKRIIADLPGNHDLGLGDGIRLPVRARFNAYFGDGNRLVLVGNHSFISIDSVSLSAKGQVDPATGLPGIKKLIWEPTEQFLNQLGATKSRVIKRYLRKLRGEGPIEPMPHKVYGLEEPAAYTIAAESKIDTDIPSIVLSHVPFYRPAGTPCGPLRERFPPSSPLPEDGKDDGNAIRINAGLQYQNVLLPAVTNEIVDLVGDVSHVFSGDDHDYCDIIHREFTSKHGGGIREITVKSFSWAMGVRHPGVVLVSLWNPLDESGKALKSQRTTVQSQLCILPDQLGIFIRYAWTLALTLLVLLVRAVSVVHGVKSGSADGYQLSPTPSPTVIQKQRENECSDSQHLSSSSTTSDHGLPSSGLRATGKQPRPKGDGYRAASPTSSQDNLAKEKGWQDIELDIGTGGRRRGIQTSMMGAFREMERGIVTVGAPVLVWYIWLLCTS